MAFVMVVSSVSANHTGGVEGYVSCGKKAQRISVICVCSQGGPSGSETLLQAQNATAYRNIGVDVVASVIVADEATC